MRAYEWGGGQFSGLMRIYFRAFLVCECAKISTAKISTNTYSFTKKGLLLKLSEQRVILVIYIRENKNSEFVGLRGKY